MQPQIIKMDKRYIVGLFGQRSKQGEVSKKFFELYAENPFIKTNKYGCHIYLWAGSERTKRGRNYFVGFEAGHAAEGNVFATFEIPACEWAIFEVQPARWWTEGDKDVDGWMDGSPIYRRREYNGALYQLEYYKEKFQGGDDPNSLMEVWYPLERK